MADVKKTRVGNTPHAVTQYEETLRKDAYPNRKQEDVKVADSSRVAAARRAGPHGKQVDTQGRNNAVPAKKKDASAQQPHRLIDVMAILPGFFSHSAERGIDGG